MILVTCATGKTGKAIIKALVSAGRPVRAMARQESSKEIAKEMGATEVFIGDLAIKEDVLRAIEGVSAVYYIAPNMDPNERLNGDNVIAACQSNNVSHLVFHSVLHTQIEALPHHWERHFVEQSILNSKVPFTILQVGSYMQNMIPLWGKMLESGTHRMAYDIDAPMSLVDLDDVAEAATKVLGNNEYKNGIFELAGPSITLLEKSKILTSVLGRNIIAEKESLPNFLEHGKAIGLNEFTLSIMAKMFPYYDEHGLVGSDKPLGWILGRPPTTFEAFVRRIDEFYTPPS
ncbi:MAG: NmrA family NAD(P)-binding protein [Pseudomonadota bacterium]|nr:NmrA family NAD(P)-binding protein [Pseudomonadota bacterium]